MLNEELEDLEALAEKASSLGAVYLRRTLGFTTSYEVLTYKHELWLTKLSRNDAEIVVVAVNSFSYLVREMRRLQARTLMIKQKVGSHFETSRGSCDIISTENEEKAIYIPEPATFSLQDLKNIIEWAEKNSRSIR